MRQSTINKLFNGNREHYRIMRGTQPFEDDTTGAMFTQLLVNGTAVMIQEFPNEADGFEVYTAVKGNSVSAAREALGLTTGE